MAAGIDQLAHYLPMLSLASVTLPLNLCLRDARSQAPMAACLKTCTVANGQHDAGCVGNCFFKLQVPATCVQFFSDVALLPLAEIKVEIAIGLMLGEALLCVLGLD